MKILLLILNLIFLFSSICAQTEVLFADLPYLFNDDSVKSYSIVSVSANRNGKTDVKSINISTFPTEIFVETYIGFSIMNMIDTSIGVGGRQTYVFAADSASRKTFVYIHEGIKTDTIVYFFNELNRIDSAISSKEVLYYIPRRNKSNRFKLELVKYFYNENNKLVRIEEKYKQGLVVNWKPYYENDVLKYYAKYESYPNGKSARLSMFFYLLYHKNLNPDVSKEIIIKEIRPILDKISPRLN